MAELKALRLLYQGRPTAHQIPTLSEALENVRGRFMVDLDFKDGPENSAAILRKLLELHGFDQDDAPLVTIFCRDEEAYEKVKDLNDLYAVRPLYLNKGQAQDMADAGIRVMGLRQYKFTGKRANRIRGLRMQLFTNAMRLNLINLIREGLGLPIKYKKPSREKLRQFYQEAMNGGSLFIQTDYLTELVEFLKEHNAYQAFPLGRDFQPILPPQPEETGPLIV